VRDPTLTKGQPRGGAHGGAKHKLAAIGELLHCRASHAQDKDTNALHLIRPRVGVFLLLAH
jgi:hypothetical protein